MKNKTLKKIVMAGSSIFAFVMVFLIKVSATNKLVLGDNITLRNAGSSSFFNFLSQARKADMFSFARVFMWFGFILIAICMVYFVSLLILELLDQEKIIKKMNLITRVMEFVIIGGTLLILIAGLDNEKLEMAGVARETLSITLFGVSWILCLIFSSGSVISQYFIEEK